MRKLNRDKKTLCNGIEAPAANDEYLLYQTLIGTWPFGAGARDPGENFIERICDFMRKAIREAKEKTNWANPNQDYESAVLRFVKSVLESEEFRGIFLPFQRKAAYFGMLNSLSQTLIKLTAKATNSGNLVWWILITAARWVTMRAAVPCSCSKLLSNQTIRPLGRKLVNWRKTWKMVELSCTHYGECLGCASTGPRCFAKANIFHCGPRARKRSTW